MLVHLGLRVHVSPLHGLLQPGEDAGVGVELLHQQAHGDARLLGRRGDGLVGVRLPDELRHVRHATQLVAKVVEYDSHIPRPGLKIFAFDYITHIHIYK